MKQKPEDKPFTPSMRFMALIIPTEANIVSAYATQLGMVSTPHNPQKQLMLDLLAYFKSEVKAGRKPKLDMTDLSYISSKAFEFLR